ncbi:hypothetical protein ACHAPT_006465 [Fusarium lateritium]
MASAVSLRPRQFGGRFGEGGGFGGGADAVNGDVPQNNGNNGADGSTEDGSVADGSTNGGDTQAADSQTVVFTEINGVTGNECLTFRNNGEIVDAACVNEAIDRQKGSLL